MKILLIDIETSPNLCWSFDLRNAFISIEQIVEPTRMICFAAKWYGEDDVMFFSEWDDGQRLMVLEAWGLLDEADVVLHFNGLKFDEPKLNAEFFRLHLDPPSPFQTIDLWKAVSKRFEFPSSKLQWVLTEAQLPKKVETGGFRLWRGVLEEDSDSQRLMREYNMQDVRAMEPLYELMLPWIPKHPNRNLYREANTPEVCPACGKNHLEKRGFSYTGVSKFQRFRCLDCGKWSRAGRRVEGADIREAA